MTLLSGFQTIHHIMIAIFRVWGMSCSAWTSDLSSVPWRMDHTTTWRWVREKIIELKPKWNTTDIITDEIMLPWINDRFYIVQTSRRFQISRRFRRFVNEYRVKFDELKNRLRDALKPSCVRMMGAKIFHTICKAEREILSLMCVPRWKSLSEIIISDVMDKFFLIVADSSLGRTKVV